MVAPDWAARRAGRLAAEVDRLRRRPAPSSAALQGRAPGIDTADEDYVVVQSLGADRRARGFLAVGTEDRITPTERYVLNAAVALLTLTLERSRELRQAEERMGAALLRMVLAGEVATARQVAVGLFGGLPEGTIRVLVAGAGRRTRMPRRRSGSWATGPSRRAPGWGRSCWWRGRTVRTGSG